MQWRLGLDMGTNSIGWCAIELHAGKPNSLMDMGVRIFSDGREPKSGDPLAVQRRNARAARRRRDRTLKRKRQLLNCLIDNALLPKSIEDRKKLVILDPYELRKRALDEELSCYELGRAIFHLGVRRGFKSNRKELQSDDKELSTNNQKIQNTKTLLAETGSRTIGEFLYQRKERGETLRFRPTSESLYPSRDMFELEFDEIRKKQSVYHKDIDWDKIANIIFYQRPLKPQERGKCQFYHDEFRAFKITPSAQEFRILSEINNLKYFNEDGLLVPLSEEQKDKLEHELNHVKTKTFNGIRKLFSLSNHCFFNLEHPGRDKLLGNSIAFEMRKEQYFGNTWDKLPLDVQDDIIEMLVSAQTDEEVLEMLSEFEICDEKKTAVSKMVLPHDTVRLSNAFMRDCIKLMRAKHIRYDEACEYMGLHHSYTKQGEILPELPYYGKILTNSTLGAHPEADEDKPELKYGKIGNPTVHISLNQLRKVVNALIKRFGNPSEIVIELSRDLKTSRKEKSKILAEQGKNRKRNEKIVEDLINTFKIAKPTSWDIKKYLLWEELGNNPMERRCIYCGKQIPASQLFSPAIEIEHILPFSKTLSSAMSNLTVAHRSCNAMKKNQTPFEAFGSSPKGFSWEGIVERATQLTNQRKKENILEQHFDKLQESADFLERQLNDNRYLSRATQEYLSAICDKSSIWSTPGRQTSILRAKWGLNTILNNNHDTWYKNRYDHRHHAIDALVISLTDRYLINKMAQLNQESSPYDIVVPVLPFSRMDIEDKVKRIIPSIKIDHGYQGKLFKETAATQKQRIEKIPVSVLKSSDVKDIESTVIKSMFETSNEKFNITKKTVAGFLQDGETEPLISLRRTYWVARKPIDSITAKDIKKKRIFDRDLCRMISNSISGDEKPNELKKKLQEFSEMSGIRHVRYIPDNQLFIKVLSEPHKGYENDEFHAVIIWRIPGKKKFTYKGTFISRAEGYAMNERKLDIELIKPHPAAKRMMTLYKNDTIAIATDDGKSSVFARIVGFSTTQNKLDIRPIFASEDCFTWLEYTNVRLLDSYWSKQKGQNYKSINALFSESTISIVRITPDGLIM